MPIEKVSMTVSQQLTDLTCHFPLFLFFSLFPSPQVHSLPHLVHCMHTNLHSLFLHFIPCMAHALLNNPYLITTIPLFLEDSIQISHNNTIAFRAT